MQEFVDFLARQPPYDSLTQEELERIAGRIDVELFTEGSVIVGGDDAQVTEIYVIRAGAVSLYLDGVVIDELGSGDSFGQLAMLTGIPPATKVVALDDTLCYLIPDPRSFLRHPERLFAPYGTLTIPNRVQKSALTRHIDSPIERYIRPIDTIDADTTVAEAARLTSASGQSCVLVRVGRQIGIVTDSDFRDAVGVPEFSGLQPVMNIANVPARTVQSDTSVSQAYLLMLRFGIQHLIVNDDLGNPLGVVRAFDVAAADFRDPLIVRSAVERSETEDDLRQAYELLRPSTLEMFEAGMPPLRISQVLSTVRDSILRRTIEMTMDQGDEDQLNPAWLVLGSQARREIMPSSDLDTALVLPGSGLLNRKVSDQDDAVRVLDAIARIGIPPCPNGANATNPLFRKTSQEWIESVKRRIEQPVGAVDLLLISIVSDSRPIYNSRLASETIRDMTRFGQSRLFLKMMFDFALSKRPPTGFVRDFVVESTGIHRGHLDLKRRGLMPVRALGQWLAVVSGSLNGNTIDRIRRGVESNLLTHDEAEALEMGFETMFDMLFTEEVHALRKGTEPSPFLDPKKLGVLERRRLRDTFRAIAKVQARLEGEWVSRLG